MRIPEKATGWWLQYCGWVLLPLMAASWLPLVPAWGRAAIAVAVVLASVKTSAVLRARRARDEQGGAR